MKPTFFYFNQIRLELSLWYEVLILFLFRSVNKHRCHITQFWLIFQKIKQRLTSVTSIFLCQKIIHTYSMSLPLSRILANQMFLSVALNSKNDQQFISIVLLNSMQNKTLINLLAMFANNM